MEIRFTKLFSLVCCASALLCLSGLAQSIESNSSDVSTVMDWSGDLTYRSLFDFKDDIRELGLRDDLEGESLELTLDLSVRHGPFSGSLILEEFDDADIDESDPAQIFTQYEDWRLSLSNLQFVERDFVFGQLGSIHTTNGFVDLLTDEVNEGLGYGTSVAARYVDPDYYLMSQIGANYVFDSYLPDFENENNISASLNYLHYTGERDSVIHLDLQYAEDPDNIARPLFFGVAADVWMWDDFRVRSVFQRAADMTFGFRVDKHFGRSDYYMQWADPSWETENDNTFKFGRVYMSGHTPMTYTASLKRVSTVDLWVEVRADYKKRNLTSYALFSRAFVANDSDSEVGLGATLTGPSLVYKLEYFNQVQDVLGILPGVQQENYLELSVGYQF